MEFWWHRVFLKDFSRVQRCREILGTEDIRQASQNDDLGNPWKSRPFKFIGLPWNCDRILGGGDSPSLP